MRLEVCSFKGQTRVDLRRWTSCDTYRTRNGVYFTQQNWQEFLQIKDKILTGLKNIQRDGFVREFCDIGDDIYISLQSPRREVDIRLFFRDEDLLKSTYRGLKLTPEQFQIIIDNIADIDTALEELNEMGESSSSSSKPPKWCVGASTSTNTGGKYCM